MENNTNNSNQNEIEQLKKLIRVELAGREYEPSRWPKVCELKSTEAGMNRLEELVIRMVASDGMGIGSALALIEQEFNHA